MPGKNSTTPELVDVLTRMEPESESETRARVEAEAQVREILTTLDPSKRRMQSYGTVAIEIRHDDETEMVQMRIKSIPGHIMSKIRSSEVFPQIPQRKNPDGDGWIEDESDPSYLPKLQETHTKISRMRYRKVLHGLDMDILGLDGRDIVWSRSGDVRNEEEAIASLEAMGFSDAALNKISLAVDEISGQIDRAEQTETEKKS